MVGRIGKKGQHVLPSARSDVDMFDDDGMVDGFDHPSWSGIRLPDGRALSWAEYGSPRGLPCVLVPDRGSSRLAPGWLLHDSALPSAIRLLAIDRPGTGYSDPVGLGAPVDLAADLEAMILTLAVGRVALVGIGDGADDALALAADRPDLIAGVGAVAVRLTDDQHSHHGRRWFRRQRPVQPAPALGWFESLNGAEPGVKSSWEPALQYMQHHHRKVLGERWQEEDFLAAYAADLAEYDEWSGVGATDSRQLWRTDPDLAGLPVHFWHGTEDGPTTVRELQALASEKAWSVTAVSSPTAMFDCWPQILTTTSRSFSAAA